MLIPVILSGGAGSRLWPVSRESHPKPFIKLPDGESLIEKTYSRVTKLDNVKEILTVTNRNYFFLTRDELNLVEDAQSLEHSFILEKSGRNTAPAILMAAFKVQETYGDEALMLVLPADHLIADIPAFSKSVEQASTLASEGYLVTFGIEPTYPETGYGYIEAGEGLSIEKSHQVNRFVEKPDEKTAQEYLDSGRFFWNSGMFCFQAGALLKAYEQYASQLFTEGLVCWKQSKVDSKDVSSIELDGDSFDLLEDISIDYAIMEPAEKRAVVKSSFGWNDVGSWKTISELTEADEHGNKVTGEAVLVDVSNTFVQNDDRLIGVIGVDDLAIIDTPDALLVSRNDRVQDVKKIYQQLKAKGHKLVKEHTTTARPWGTYTILAEGDLYKVKSIVVHPGGELSLQMHHHRSEHWIVVTGTAQVTNGDQEFLLQANESTFIPAGQTHKLANPGKIPLTMIEVQSGQYLGEDDIVRYSDSYGRA